MIEFILIFAAIRKHIKPLAQERNRSILAWSLGAIIVWFGIEFAILIIGSIVISFLLPDNALAIFILYLAAVFGGSLGAELIKWTLQQQPIVSKTQL